CFPDLKVPSAEGRSFLFARLAGATAMIARIIDGKQIAQSSIAQVKASTERLVADTGIRPGLAVVLVGEDPASQVYVASKGRMAKECGFHSVQHTLPI